MATPTVLSVGGINVSASGGAAGDALANAVATINLLLSTGKASVESATIGTNGQLVFPPPNTTKGFVNILTIPSDFTGTINVPKGYQDVVYNGPSVIHGGDTNLLQGYLDLVAGDLNFSGGSLSIIGTGSGNVNDSATGAVMTFYGNEDGSAGGVYTIVGSGANQQISVSKNVQAFATVSGANSIIKVGSASDTVSAQSTAPNFVQLSGSADTLSAASGTIYADIAAASDVIYTANAADTVFATNSQSGPVTFSGSGEALVWDTIGGANVTASSNLWYNSNGATASTITATAGSDTIFAATGVNYQGSGAASTFFVGGSAADSVSAGQNATLFSGTGNSFFTVGSSSFLFVGNSVASGSATETIVQNGTSGSAAIWSNSNENLVISTVQGAAGEANTIGAVGSNMTINAMNGSGGNTFEVFTQSNGSGAAFTGSSTLIGSNAGGDQFNIWVGNTPVNGGTVDIMNWQASDKLFVGDVDSSNASLPATYVSELNALENGTANTLTLADGTTVVFNVKPTNISHV